MKRVAGLPRIEWPGDLTKRTPGQRDEALQVAFKRKLILKSKYNISPRTAATLASTNSFCHTNNHGKQRQLVRVRLRTVCLSGWLAKQNPDKTYEQPPSELFSSTKSYWLPRNKIMTKSAQQEQVPRVRIRTACPTKQNSDKPYEPPPQELFKTAANLASTKSYCLSRTKS